MAEFSGRATCQNCFRFPSEKECTPKEKNLLPQEAICFLLELTPFQKGLIVQGRNQEVTKVDPLIKMAEIHQVYQAPLGLKVSEL